LEYNATLISFVVATLTFSDQSLKTPSQEQCKTASESRWLRLPLVKLIWPRSNN